MNKPLLTAIIGLSAVAGVSAAEKYYYIEGNNINVRETPNGKVIGKLNGPKLIEVEEQNGWLPVYHDTGHGYVRAFVAKSVAKEIDNGTMSPAALGEYMGDSTMYEDGYSLCELVERDGYLVFHINEYSQPSEYGLRNQQSYTLIGTPYFDGIEFTHASWAYNSSNPMRAMMEPQSEISDGGLTMVFDKEGNMYSDIGSFSPQEPKASQPATGFSERNIFELKGDVKKSTHIRVHPDNVIEKSGMLQDYIHEYYFDPNGNIYAFYVYDIDGNGLQKNDYKQNGDRVDMVCQRMRDKEVYSTITGSYKRQTYNYGVSYESTGNIRETAADGSLISEGDPGSEYIFNMNGFPRARRFNEVGVPFDADSFAIANAYCEVPYFDDNSAGPTQMKLQYELGGEGTDYEVNITYQEVDSHGNWLRRTVLTPDGHPLFMEKRILEYY